MKSYWEQRYGSHGIGTAASVYGDPEKVNRRAKQRFANTVLEELADLDVDIGSVTVLSVGSGTGLISERIAENVDSLFGIDFSATAIRQVTSDQPAGRYAVASADMIPSDQPVDIVTAFSVLYHVVDEERWRNSISELARLTDSEGYLLLRINWSSEASGAKTDSHFFSRPREVYEREFQRNSLVVKDVVDLPVQPRGFQFLSRMPGSRITKRLISPLVLSAGLWKDHSNKLLILQKECGN